MTTDTPTPRTDVEEIHTVIGVDGLPHQTKGRFTSIRFARQLERELAAAQRDRKCSALEGLYETGNPCGTYNIMLERAEKAEAELTAAQERNKNLEQLVADDCETDTNIRKLLAAYDRSDSYGVDPLETLVERVLKDLAAAKHDCDHFFQYSGRLLEQLAAAQEREARLHETILCASAACDRLNDDCLRAEHERDRLREALAANK